MGCLPREGKTQGVGRLMAVYAAADPETFLCCDNDYNSPFLSSDDEQIVEEEKVDGV